MITVHDILCKMSKPTIAIYFDEAYFENDQITFIDDYYKAAYCDLIEQILSKGVNVIITRDAAKNYIPDFQFKSYWQASADNTSVSLNRVEDRPIQFDLLFDKGQFPFSMDRKINPDRISTVARDKYLSYLLASDFHPKSFLLTSQPQQDIFIETHKEAVIVLKELAGFGGKQVYIGRASDYQHNLSFPMIAQHFIDTSDGFPGLAGRSHDIRVALFDGEPIHGLVRQTAEGSFKSNFSEGGSVRALFVKEIPQELVRMTQAIDVRFNTSSSRLFSADWGFDKATQSWKLFEINSAPGLALNSVDGPAADEYTKLLAENLVRSVQNAAS